MKLKAIVIFYFTGTGNAFRVANWIGECAIDNGLSFEMFDLSNIKTENVADLIHDKMVMIISPIHGFNYPRITLNFIYNFPKGNNGVVLMNTRAGMRIGSFITPGLTGIAFMFSSILLKRKGYRIKGQIPYDMPSNWISVHPVLTEKTIGIIHQRIKERVEKHSNRIFSGRKDFVALWDIIQDLLISPVAIAYFVLGRFILAKTLFASYKCNNCGLCIKQCPVKAIKQKRNHPFWKFTCESCMHCVINCPQKSIHAGHGFIAIVIVASSLLTSSVYILLSEFFESGIIRFVMSNLTFLFFIWLLYRLQHLLLGNKFVNKIITYTALTNLRFLGLDKFKSNYKPQ